jgi:F0F1-type ATP synthase membrane subunit c/vacuolar-type H+-ATPase subunit K
MAIPRPAYAGPHCPRCRAPLDDGGLQDGANVCLHCLGDFEARVFHPPQRSARVLQLAQSGPEGAISCANHARNAAVAACDRCGLLICSLCQLDVDGTKLCPSCFDRLAQEGAGDTRTRFRDYGSLAGLWAFLGLGLSWMFLGVPFGILSTYFCIKAFRNRESRSSLLFVVLALLIALADIVLSTLLFVSLFRKTK